MIEDLYIDDKITKIGVKLSGGADSTIVYYALCDYYKDRPDVEIYPITVSFSGAPHYQYFAKRAARRVAELTGKLYTSRVNGYVSHRNITVSMFLDLLVDEQEKQVARAVKEHGVQIVYSGITANPNILSLITFIEQNKNKFIPAKMEELLTSIKQRDKERDDHSNRATVQIMDGVIRNAPFINKDKLASYKAYKDYNVIDSLYPYTMSCEHLSPNKPSEQQQHCGHCFFCLERLYAFKRLV